MKILLLIVLCIMISGCASTSAPTISKNHNHLPVLIFSIATAEINYIKQHDYIIIYCKDNKKCTDELQRINKLNKDIAIRNAYSLIP